MVSLDLGLVGPGQASQRWSLDFAQGREALTRTISLSDHLPGSLTVALPLPSP